jgi:hypothetical protein
MFSWPSPGPMAATCAKAGTTATIAAQADDPKSFKVFIADPPRFVVLDLTQA